MDLDARLRYSRSGSAIFSSFFSASSSFLNSCSKMSWSFRLGRVLAHYAVLLAVTNKWRGVREAKQRGDAEVIIWGSGMPRREFLYSDDMADACVLLMSLADNEFETVICPLGYVRFMSIGNHPAVLPIDIWQVEVLPIEACRHLAWKIVLQVRPADHRQV